MRQSCLLIVGVLLLSTLASAEVYKCPDGKGRHTFSNAPCSGTSDAPLIPHTTTPQEQRRQDAQAIFARMEQQTLPADYQQQIDARLVSQLKDPDSRKVAYLGTYGSAACGTVNAKNALGGYAGHSLFVATFASGGQIQDVTIYSEALLQTTLALHTVNAQVLVSCGVHNPYP